MQVTAQCEKLGITILKQGGDSLIAVTNLILILIRHKNQLSTNYKGNPTPENKKIESDYRNKLTNRMKIMEDKYIEDQLELHKHDMRQSWKIIKEIIGKGPNFDNTNIEYNINGTITRDPILICNTFNDYFVQIGPQLAKKFDDKINPMTYITHTQSSIFIPYISENEIKNIIHSLKSSSPGWDGISVSIIKPCMNLYIKPLNYIL